MTAARAVLVLAGTGERVRVDATYYQAREWCLAGKTIEVQTRGTYPNDPPMVVAFSQVAAVLPAGELDEAEAYRDRYIARYEALRAELIRDHLDQGYAEHEAEEIVDKIACPK